MPSGNWLGDIIRGVMKQYLVSWNSGGANEEGVSLMQRKPLFDVKRRPFNAKERPLCFQTLLFTPLSIRRGAGGEAASPSFGGAWGGSITFLIHYL